MYHRIANIVKRLDLDLDFISSGDCIDFSPVTGEQIASFPTQNAEQIERVIQRSKKAYEEWRQVPSEDRSQFVRLFAEELRSRQEVMAELIVVETGKIYDTALREVKRAVKICDIMADLECRFSGFQISSKSKNLIVSEQWQPLGPVAVITSFNFPLRIWVYNALVALICGNSVIWRPSRKSCLTAYAVNMLLRRAKARSAAYCPEYLSQIVVCDHEDSSVMAKSADIPVMCIAGSPVIAARLQSEVGQRLGRTLLSLGGNNAAIITPSANIDYSVQEVMFSAIADAGQRSTSLRRLFVHSSIYDEVVAKLKNVFANVHVDSPFERKSQIGPLIDKESFENMQTALDTAKQEGGIVFGGNRLDVGHYDKAYYVAPALVEMPMQTETVRTETLAPILYVMRYDELSNAIASVNEYKQTLLSCIFSNDLKEVGFYNSMDGVQSEAVVTNAGTVGYDLASMFTAGRENKPFSSDVWRPFMQSKTCIKNFDF